MEQVASFYSSGGRARGELGHRLDRPVLASMSAGIQQALLARLRCVGVPMHKTIPINDDLDEIACKRLQPNFGRLGIVEQFHCLRKTI